MGLADELRSALNEQIAFDPATDPVAQTTGGADVTGFLFRRQQVLEEHLIRLAEALDEVRD